MWLLLMLLAFLFNGLGVFGLRILAGMGLAGQVPILKLGLVPQILIGVVVGADRATGQDHAVGVADRDDVLRAGGVLMKDDLLRCAPTHRRNPMKSEGK